jgi:hypothetical protein
LFGFVDVVAFACFFLEGWRRGRGEGERGGAERERETEGRGGIEGKSVRTLWR